MKQVWMSGAAVVMAVSMATLGAQQPPTQQPPTTPPTTQPPTTQPPTTQPPTTTPQTPATAGQDTAMTTTVQGCVYREEAVPGRTPNVAERAGVLEDYILVAGNAMTAGTSGTTPPTTPPTTTPPTSATGTAGAAMGATQAYKLEKIADEQLRAMVGKRVEVTGRIDAELSDTARTGTATGTTPATPARDKSLGPDKIELPEFEVTSIREVAGTCPATPNIRK